MDIRYITFTINGLLMIVTPIVLSVYLTRHFKTGWRLVWIGAATFILSQVGHIPFNYALDALFDNGILPAPPEEYALVFSAVILGLSAGIWEEGARYIAYRWPARDARSWGKGLVLGSGHGGIESILLGFLFFLTFVQLVALRDADLSKIVPADQLALAQQQVEAFWSAPLLSTILGGLERVFALCFHLSASVIVLQVFIRRQILWLFLAIGWHAFVDALAVYAIPTWGIYTTEAVIGVFALISIGIIFTLRSPEPEPDEQVIPELLPVKDATSLSNLPDIEESTEDIEKTRYN